MDKPFMFRFSRYELGVIADALRDKLHADADGRFRLDGDERKVIQKTLGEIQGVLEGDVASPQTVCA